MCFSSFFHYLLYFRYAPTPHNMPFSAQTITLFIICFLFYEAITKHVTRLKEGGGSSNSVLLFMAYSILCVVTTLVFLFYLGWSTTWWAPIALILVGGIGAGIAENLLLKGVFRNSSVAIIGIVCLPVLFFLLFKSI